MKITFYYGQQANSCRCLPHTWAHLLVIRLSFALNLTLSGDFDRSFEAIRFGSSFSHHPQAQTQSRDFFLKHQPNKCLPFSLMHLFTVGYIIVGNLNNSASFSALSSVGWLFCSAAMYSGTSRSIVFFPDSFHNFILNNTRMCSYCMFVCLSILHSTMRWFLCVTSACSNLWWSSWHFIDPMWIETDFWCRYSTQSDTNRICGTSHAHTHTRIGILKTLPKNSTWELSSHQAKCCTQNCCHSFLCV